MASLVGGYNRHFTCGLMSRRAEARATALREGCAARVGGAQPRNGTRGVLGDSDGTLGDTSTTGITVSGGDTEPLLNNGCFLNALSSAPVSSSSQSQHGPLRVQARVASVQAAHEAYEIEVAAAVAAVAAAVADAVHGRSLSVSVSRGLSGCVESLKRPALGSRLMDNESAVLGEPSSVAESVGLTLKRRVS
jgi:hypothetical protein